jgi:hypothetical protein
MTVAVATDPAMMMYTLSCGKRVRNTNAVATNVPRNIAGG